MSRFTFADAVLAVMTVVMCIIGLGMFVYPLSALWYQHPELHP